ncbi:MAG: hypothetical protein PHV33_10085 [Elusimicrobiales bacterium]|nr:hypothetical protein [Elusimicrobiales bacterium]
MKKFLPAPRRLALFLWHWLFGGFFLGTLTLTGPVRWATGYARTAGWGETPEKLLVFLLIGALAAVSLLLAGWLTAKTGAATAKAARYGLPAASLALGLAALGLWMNPRVMTGGAAQSAAESFSWSEFTFGPYPEEDRLAALKAEGYTAVISLLSPAVLPFEPVLLAREREEAEETGLELIHIPMLPWVSSNDHVAAKLKELQKRGPGKYYVHCYLGKDRVNVFKRMLAATSGGAVIDPDTSSARTLKGLKSFERGEITELGKDVYLTPYPTDEEFFGYIINGTVETLVSLLDPANPENLPWLKKEAAIAEKYGLKLVSCPWLALDKAGKQAAAREIRAAKKPAVVHAFLSRSSESKEFEAYYAAAKAK